VQSCALFLAVHASLAAAIVTPRVSITYRGERGALEAHLKVDVPYFNRLNNENEISGVELDHSSTSTEFAKAAIMSALGSSVISMFHSEYPDIPR